MTLPFYDELLLEKKPRVCGAVVFSRFMKNPVNCKANMPPTSSSQLNRYYKNFDDMSPELTVADQKQQQQQKQSSSSSTNNTELNDTHRSLPSTAASENSQPGSPQSQLPQTITDSSYDAAIAHIDTTTKTSNSSMDISNTNSIINKAPRSCMPTAPVLSNPHAYQDLAKLDLPLYMEDEELIGIQHIASPASINHMHQHQQHAEPSPSSTSMTRRSMEMDKYFEQHVPSQNIIQFDPSADSGMVSPVPEVSELTCDVPDILSPTQEVLKKTQDLLEKTKYLEQLAAMEEEDDKEDALWNILYASPSGGGGTVDEEREPKSNGRTAKQNSLREPPASTNDVVDYLKEQRETYKSEADALREEMEMFRQQLSTIRNILPQQSLREENDERDPPEDVWDKVDSQQSENFFNEDWEFSFNGREVRDQSDRSDRSIDVQDCDKRDKVVVEYTSNVQRLAARFNRNDIDSRDDRDCHDSHAEGSEDGDERQKVSFMVPEVTDACEYDKNRVIISAEPKESTILPPRVQRWKEVLTTAESMQSSEDEDFGCERDYHPNSFEDENDSIPEERIRDYYNQLYLDSDEHHNVTTQTEDSEDEPDYDRDVQYNAAHTQTEDDEYQFYTQSQELEVIPEVDECELSNSNGEYTKDMHTIQKLLKKYGKKASFSMEESVEEDTPLVQIENIEAVIEYRGSKDPDAWFERHANLSQDKSRDKKNKKKRRPKKVSLTVGLSPKSVCQASRERAKKNS
ncbi:MAG: hypothetical protein SGILL_009205, partial [Bacillariaceae sp.]